LAGAPRTRYERLLIFIGRLVAAAPASDALSAKQLLDSTLNAVEDEFSGVPFAPDIPEGSGRMYPAQDDNRRVVAGRPDLVRYRHRGHETIFGSNGAMLIRQIANGDIVLSKAGSDGKEIVL